MKLTTPKQDDFMLMIETIKNEARKEELEYIDILSMDLHKKVGYDSYNHRMASCCQAMYKAIDSSKGDQILSAPNKGKGSKLLIRYTI